METIAPEKAVFRGVLLVNIPTLILLISLPFACYYLRPHFNYNLYIAMPISVALSLLLCYCYWAWAIVQWKLWAYANTSNIYELKRQAVEEKLIYEDDSWWNNREFKNKATTQKLTLLESSAKVRYDAVAVDDDVTVPESIAFYYPLWETLLVLLFAVLALWLGIRFNLHPEEIKSGKEGLAQWVAIPVSFWLFYTFYKRLKKRKHPLLLFSNEGLYIDAAKKSYTWMEVYHILFNKQGNTHYVTFQTKDGLQEVEIEFNASQSRLAHLYRIYRLRHRRLNPGLYLEKAEGDEDD